uniref:Poly(3-hydroxybutyrate) depolymerase n=1 Tax=Haliea sp. ETY-M TaxID=1055105 RepID=A0A455R3N2_9GAMM|nr:hypothetical protein [Haliea sp. ETY-M]
MAEPRWSSYASYLLVFVFGAAVLWALAGALFSEDASVATAEHRYALGGTAARCEPGRGAERAPVQRIRLGADRLLVATPSNYDASVLHPLLLVFAPAGASALASEGFLGLTETATRAGFVVAYASSRPLSAGVLQEFGTLALKLAEGWCIDTQRVAYAGHSDGGTAALAMGFLDGIAVPPAAIVASAAGIRGQDIASYRCPTGVPLQQWHGRADELFPPPEYGREVFRWWSRCSDADFAETAPANCNTQHHQRLVSQGGYCEHSGAHLAWPADGEATMLAFLQRHTAADR